MHYNVNVNVSVSVSGNDSLIHASIEHTGDNKCS